MLDKLRTALTPKVRLWLYAVAIALFSLLQYYNLVDDQAAPIWLNLISTVFVIGGQAVAVAHTPRGGNGQ
ncbi:hypothetical protein MSTE_03542 [Mycobacteroides stephanolepidis]|uniref:Holin n=1 Tax=[Mycobacterium] stephanolepidis TaxID=1520670 RepID=A0A1Z4F0Y5_9MYCO|nr:hypothetical protein [[Mycobacterium] stephanolepidis]BAX98842.1 hypothetical protein MSTE_03542 [[Mycobacterium] stephanolepidis]